MDPILEQSSSINYAQKVREATSLNDIAALFTELFGVPALPDPNGYKNGDSDYGLKVRGVKAREKLNEQCKEILTRVKKPEDLTAEDRAILLQYSGRGGLTENSQWEYYTPTPIAQGIWDAMKANGFENGNVLEPSCGAGVFLGTKPAGVIMSANDLDPTSSGVASLLNPGDYVSNSPFEDIVIETPDDAFDSCVGNVPFGNARGKSMAIDPAYRNERRVERYFLLRILDKIKPGGLACLVVPISIIGDKGAKWKEFRIAVSKKAEFLGAHKLPSSTFGGKGGQGTDTVTDVIVLRKHGRELLDKLNKDEIPTETLKTANVLWDEFISGKYWQGEGRQYIMGRYVPKDAKDRFSREKVEGNIDDATMRRNLARKFHSRINWEILNDAEPILRNYVDGDRRYINGDPYEYRNGQWIKVESVIENTEFEPAKYGADSLESLEALLKETPGALELTFDQANAVYNSYPHLLGRQQIDAIEFALSQPRFELREQLYRGSIFGSMLAKMGADEEAGEDVSARRLAMQDVIVAEMNKYGHPRNNPKFVVEGTQSRSFGMFMNSIDENGKFSDFLSGKLDKTKAKGYSETDIESIVSWLVAEKGDQVEFEDIKALYKGSIKLDDISDLAQFDNIAITPDGMLEMAAKYCSGDVVAKMNELKTAMAHIADDRLLEKFQKQIELMDSKIKRLPVEDITFGLQNKWFNRKYILDFLHDNGYPDAVFGSMQEVEDEDYDGKPIIRTQFVENPDAEKGEFLIEGVRGKPTKFVAQLEKYLNGGNVTSNDSEKISEYREQVTRIESMFDSWMKQNPDSDHLAEVYSYKFNGFVPVEYETTSLGIDDLISGEIVPHTYQNAEVRRLSEQGSGICGFGTGLGKSFTSLALAAYNYKKGRAKRTCIVVPSAVLENWYHEARSFYNESYLRSKVLFVGLEPQFNDEGGIEQKAILDENGQPKTGKNGQPLMQDVVRFAKSKEDIHAAMWKIPQSNYSLVVMTKEKFQTIPVRPETMKAYTDDMVKRELMSQKEADKANKKAGEKGGKSYADDVRENQAGGQYSREGGAKKGELPYLEDMGFDSIISDESHFFKNSLKPVKTGGVIGVPAPVPSDIAIDMSIKCDWLRRKNDGRGVYGLTATPVTNSPVEIYNMLSLVAPREDFESMGIYTVDDFVRLFGEMRERDRINVAQQVVKAQCLIGFKNLAGLRNIFRKYVNIKSVEDVDDIIHVPNAEETNESVEISEEQAKIYARLKLEAAAAAKDLAAIGKLMALGISPRSIFSIMRDMDRCTTDMDLYKRQMTFVFDSAHKAVIQGIMPTLPTTFTVEEKDEETGEKSKITYEFTPTLIDNGDTVSLIVHEQHEEALLLALREANIAESEASHPITPKYAKLIENLKKHLETGGKQIVFTEEKTQHQKLKRIIGHNLPLELTKMGIINAEDAAGDKLDAISKAYNAGSLLIVIANKKAEVGVNLQKGTTAIHHLTLPWTPASINQRNGRGVRQGNKVDTVQIYYYHGKGTFDAYRKQLLQSKANWINQLLTSNEATAENADIEADDEMAALLSGNIEQYRAKKAEAAKQRQEKEKQQFINRLRILATLEDSLSTWESRKAGAKDTAKFEIDQCKQRIKRYEAQNKGEEAIKKEKARLGKLENKLASLDKKFDEEKTRSESQRNMNKRMLQEAAKKGELPFDETLIDNPANALVTMKGNLFCLGDTIELEGARDNYMRTLDGVYLVKEIDQEKRRLLLEGITVTGNNWFSASDIDVKAKKVSYSTSELAEKRLLSGNIPYMALLTSGVTKEQFLANLNVAPINFQGGGIVQNSDGNILILTGNYDLREGMTPVWPEPQNEDFRKKVFMAYFKLMRGYSYEVGEKLLTALFGPDYKEQAENYASKATESAINEIIAQVWDEYGKPQLEDESFLRSVSMGYGWGRLVSTIARQVKHLAQDGNYDNLDDFVRLTSIFCDSKKAEVDKLVAQQAERDNKDELERKRANPNFKEVPEDIRQKFKELGMEVYYNTEDANLGATRRSSAYYSPYERLFIKDEAGIGGRLYMAKERIKALFNAQFTKKWSERFGSWWHMPASTDLNQLYEAIVG